VAAVSEQHIVTNRDIFQKLEHVEDVVIEVKTRIEVLPHFEQRIASLEKWRYGLPAGVFMGGLALIESYVNRRG
jgi:hypothetical protein